MSKVLAQIFYAKNSFIRSSLQGVDYLKESGIMPTVATIEETHKKVHQLQVDDTTQYCEELYSLMNQPGIIWDGIIGMKPEEVGHASMSVGDVIIVDDKGFMVDWYGFKSMN